MYLKISNKGQVEVEALTLVGASTKRGDSSQIGMFGSGNKYAMAYFLRNGINPIIYSGEEKIEISTELTKLRDDEFNVICVNGAKTSITTEMGHHWKLWMALREIYANAQDEGLISFEKVEDVDPKENETHFYIPINDEISDFMFNLDDYFSMEKNVLFENERGKILKKHSDKARIYRRGILVYETTMNSIFDYDLYNIKINEDRMVNHEWYIWEEMWSLLQECDNENIVRSALYGCNERGRIERNISSVSTIQFSYINDAWDAVLKDKFICSLDIGGYVKDSERAKTLFLPSKLYHTLVTAIKGIKEPTSLKKSNGGVFFNLIDDESSLFERLMPVMDFFAVVKFKIPYKIKFVTFTDSSVLGMADDETIYLSPHNLDKGVHFTVNTIIEEYIHLKSGASDETRAFQDASIDMFITYMKELNNIKSL